jgi:CRISPR-associated protein Cmr2
LLQKALEYPLLKQNQGIPQYHDLARTLVELGVSQTGQTCTDFITHFIGIAEFLARDSRAGGAQ